MHTPIEEVALEDQGALMVLSEHADLTELCRAKQLNGKLIWFVYKELALEDAQEMKRLLFLEATEFQKLVRKNQELNDKFVEVRHPYGLKKENDDEEGISPS